MLSLSLHFFNLHYKVYIFDCDPVMSISTELSPAPSPLTAKRSVSEVTSGGRPAPQAMWSRSKSNVESTSKASATEKQIVSRTRRLKPLNPFVASDQGTHVLYKRKKENCRLPRAKVNGELPCSPSHAYAVIPKKLTRTLLSPRERKDGKYPNMAIAFY